MIEIQKTKQSPWAHEIGLKLRKKEPKAICEITKFSDFIILSLPICNSVLILIIYWIDLAQPQLCLNAKSMNWKWKEKGRGLTQVSIEKGCKFEQSYFFVCNNFSPLSYITWDFSVKAENGIEWIDCHEALIKENNASSTRSVKGCGCAQIHGWAICFLVINYRHGVWIFQAVHQKQAISFL